MESPNFLILPLMKVSELPLLFFQLRKCVRTAIRPLLNEAGGLGPVQVKGNKKLELLIQC